MQIEIQRIRHSPETIDGCIYTDDIKVCDCAENAHRCLPEGTYSIALVKCKQYSRKMIQIQFTENSQAICGNLHSPKNPCESCQKLSYVGNNTNLPVCCPMLKPGNGSYNRTDGSIIVGSSLTPGCLIHPKQAFDALYERIRKNAARGHKTNLVISS